MLLLLNLKKHSTEQMEQKIIHIQVNCFYIKPFLFDIGSLTCSRPDNFTSKGRFSTIRQVLLLHQGRGRHVLSNLFGLIGLLVLYAHVFHTFYCGKSLNSKVLLG
jgi:hypothetical protein